MKIIERWKKSLYRKAVKHRLIAPQVIVLMICLSMKSGEQIWITSLYVTSIC